MKLYFWAVKIIDKINGFVMTYIHIHFFTLFSTIEAIPEIGIQVNILLLNHTVHLLAIAHYRNENM